MMIGVRRSKSPCSYYICRAAPPQAKFPGRCKYLISCVSCDFFEVDSCMRVLWVCCASGKPAAQRCVGEWMTKMDGLNAAMHA